jgi:hypothetical protein
MHTAIKSFGHALQGITPSRDLGTLTVRGIVKKLTECMGIKVCPNYGRF